MPVVSRTHRGARHVASINIPFADAETSPDVLRELSLQTHLRS